MRSAAADFNSWPEAASVGGDAAGRRGRWQRPPRLGEYGIIPTVNEWRVISGAVPTVRGILRLQTMTTVANPPTESPLPTPQERPEADVVIYDGHCRLCIAQIRKLLWWDCQQRLAYL